MDCYYTVKSYHAVYLTRNPELEKELESLNGISDLFSLSKPLAFKHKHGTYWIVTRFFRDENPENISKIELTKIVDKIVSDFAEKWDVKHVIRSEFLHHLSRNPDK